MEHLGWWAVGAARARLAGRAAPPCRLSQHNLGQGLLVILCPHKCLSRCLPLHRPRTAQPLVQDHIA